MKQILKFFIYKILIALPIFSFVVAAQAPFPAEGKIFKINNSSLNLSDMELRVISTVKVILENNKPGAIKDLQPGDYVGVTFITIDKKQYVDTINVVDEKRSNAFDQRPLKPN